jgi:hypothetical protein
MLRMQAGRSVVVETAMPQVTPTKVKLRYWLDNQAVSWIGYAFEDHSIFLPYWQKVENTGYAQAIKIAVKDLYGIDGFDSAAWKPLKEAMEKR